MKIPYRVSFSIILIILFSNFYCLKKSKEEKISSEFKILENPQSGLWESDPTKGIKSVPTLTLGNKEDKNQLFNAPTDIAVDKAGNILILDSRNHRIQKFDRIGKYLQTFGREGQGPGEFNQPLGLTIDENGRIYIADYGNRRIQVLTSEGIYQNSFEVLFPPFRVEVDSKGFIYVLRYPYFSSGEHIVYRYNNEGKLIKSFVSSIEHKDRDITAALNFASIAIDSQDKIYVCYHYNKYKIGKYSSDGELLLQFNRRLPYETYFPEVTRKKLRDNIWRTGVFTFKTTLSIATDKKDWIYVLLGGEEGEYLLDEGDLTIDIFDSKGTYLNKMQTGKSNIQRIYVDRQDNLYLIDGSNYLVYRYSMKTEE